MNTALIDRVNKVVETIALPLDLPQEAFIFLGQPRRIPNFDIIFHMLPEHLRACLNSDASILHKRRNNQALYRLQLVGDGFLIVKISNTAIVEIAISTDFGF